MKFITAMMMLVSATAAIAQRPAWVSGSVTKIENELVAKHGEGHRERLHRGLESVGSLWRDSDGDAVVFEEFASANFAGDQKTLDTLFERFQSNFEALDGHLAEIGREFRNQVDLDIGPILAVDETFAAYDPFAHVQDDMFANKLAFGVLLNFPMTTFEERMSNGEKWTRRQYAETRLAQRFSRRVPADVNLEFSKALSESESYIAGYNIWMHHLVDEKGSRLFPPKLRLLAHWNLRDEIKASYADAANGLAKQRMIEKVMDRIVTQTIPAAVIDDPRFDWDPTTNKVVRAGVSDSDRTASTTLSGGLSATEPNTRYERLLANFRAGRRVDPYSPSARTLIRRSFDESRELSEDRVHQMLEKVLSSPLALRTGKMIAKRLGRQLEPFDIWYDGFRPRKAYTEEQLDEIVRKRYPNADAFTGDIPNILVKLGFSNERAEYVARNIVVDPARGSGHALGSGMRSAKVHLRTRIGANGMDYKGFNIAVHELGHNVEQTFSLNDIDYPALAGVPNNAFTEALAFVFQNKDLELLGLTGPSANDQGINAIKEYWATYEIAGVALVDMATWQWMYDNPNATPAELKDTVVRISRQTWNKYYAPVFGKRDVVLLGIYSHMISNPIYLPDYPIGHMIAFQIEDKIAKSGKIGPEFERMSRLGRLAPDIWMNQATGSPVGPEALLAAANRALTQIDR